MSDTPNTIKEILSETTWELVKHAKNPHDRGNRFHSVAAAEEYALQQIEKIIKERVIDSAKTGIQGKGSPEIPLVLSVISSITRRQEQALTNALYDKGEIR